MPAMRALIFVAAAALLAGAATGAATEQEAALISGMPLPARFKKVMIARLHEVEEPVRGRRLAESAVCATLKDSGYCEEFSEDDCPSPRCEYDDADKECGVKDTPEMEALAMSVMGPIVGVMSKVSECGEKTTQGTCSGACKWNAGDINACGITEATLTPFMNQISDPVMRTSMQTEYKCSMVYPVKADCDAQADCEHKVDEPSTPTPAAPVPANSTGRKLLGGGVTSDNCKPKNIVLMTSLAKNCPTQFAALKKEAQDDPDMTPAEKAAMNAEIEEAEKQAAASPAPAPWAGPWAAMAVAAAAVLAL